MKVNKVDHICIAVKDLDAAKKGLGAPSWEDGSGRRIY